MTIKRQQKRGFTLIELLVVVAVVAILAGLLLPTLGRARDRAYAAACLNHLKQLQLGWTLYANDHNDWLPPSEMNASVPKAPRWVDGNMSAFGDYAMTRTNRALLVAPGPGHIGPYVQAPDVFHCPGDRSMVNVYGKRGPLRVRSYSMNQFIGGGNGVTYTGDLNQMESVVWGFSPTAFVRYADFNRVSPAQIWVFIDEHEASITSGLFALDWFGGPQSSWIRRVAGRHGGVGSLSFADGHAELRRWKDTRTAPRVSTWEQFWALSPSAVGNPDYVWLWERTNGPWPWPVTGE